LPIRLEILAVQHLEFHEAKDYYQWVKSPFWGDLTCRNCFIDKNGFMSHILHETSKSFDSPSFHIRKMEIYFPFNKELKGYARNCLDILLRITVAKIIAGSESKKHYLLETLLSFSNENLKKQNEMEWI